MTINFYAKQSIASCHRLSMRIHVESLKIRSWREDEKAVKKVDFLDFFETKPFLSRDKNFHAIFGKTIQKRQETTLPYGS